MWECMRCVSWDSCRDLYVCLGVHYIPLMMMSLCWRVVGGRLRALHAATHHRRRRRTRAPLAVCIFSLVLLLCVCVIRGHHLTSAVWAVRVCVQKHDRPILTCGPRFARVARGVPCDILIGLVMCGHTVQRLFGVCVGATESVGVLNYFANCTGISHAFDCPNNLKVILRKHVCCRCRSWTLWSANVLSVCLCVCKQMRAYCTLEIVSPKRIHHDHDHHHHSIQTANQQITATMPSHIRSVFFVEHCHLSVM